MASTKVLKTLHNLAKRDAGSTGAYEQLRQQATADKCTFLLAHFAGSDFLLKGVSTERQAAIDMLRAQIKVLKAAKEPHAPMVELAISMGKVDFAAGLKIVQETLKNGKVANGVTLPDNVTLGCEFKSDMALYRFVHVTDTDWQVYVVSAVTRSAALHISSEILEPMCKGKGENGADVSYAVNSPTRARQVCAMCHKAIQDNLETGYASIAYGFRNGKWHNCGGVGTPMPEYQYGKYAKLFSGSAKVWRNLVNKTERLPDKETLQKRLEETG